MKSLKNTPSGHDRGSSSISIPPGHDWGTDLINTSSDHHQGVSFSRNTPGFYRGILFAVAGCSCWGLSGIFAKILFEEKGVTALWLVTVRLLAAGMILLLFSLLKYRRAVFDVWRTRRDVSDLLVFAIFGMMPSQACFFLAINYSNPAVATVLQYISPVLIMLVCCFRDRKLPTGSEIVILFAVMTGVFLMSTHGRLDQLAITPRALFWGLAAAVAVMVYTVQPARLIGRFGTLPIVGWGMLLGGVILLPFTRPWAHMPSADMDTVLLVVLVVLVGTVFAFTGYLQGVKIVGPVKGIMIAGLEPVVSVIFTSLILHVSFSGWDILGMVLVVLSVTLMAVL